MLAAGMSDDLTAPVGPSDLVLLARAFEFAAHRHRAQRRKGEAAEPYVNHLAEVAWLVAYATGGRDPVSVLGALLHDTVEDTGTTAAEIESEFGAEVAALVLEVTDDKSLPKAERKRRQVESAPHKSDRAKLIKIADKTSNLRGITNSPPKDWDLVRKRAYFEWGAQVVAGCRGVNAWLEGVFDEAHREGLAALGGS
jgi:GTP diphosphokinase / guanosine-3',5'-bis(diphosphate) 3'-diphosphatase